jgi:hypothetical protein
MKIRSTLLGAALAGSMLVGGAAQAAVEEVNMTFQSGATFSGEVTFASDYSYVTAVSGTLTGYQYGTTGYVGSGSDSINWVWGNGANFSSGAGNYSTFLMDGPGSGYVSTGGYSNWIQLSYNYSAAPVLTFTSSASYGGTDNFVDYNDPLAHGSISGVPETSTWVMMLAGFAVLGFVGHRRSKAASVAA